MLPSPLGHSSSSRSVFCGARAEPYRNRSSPSPARRHAAGELIYFPVSLAGSRRRISSSSCTCAERGGCVRSVLDRDRSWDDDRSSPSPARRHAAGELIYFPVSLAGSRRRISSSSCTCAERGGCVRSVLDRDRSWDDGDLNHKAVPLHQPRFLTLPA